MPGRVATVGIAMMSFVAAAIVTTTPIVAEDVPGYPHKPIIMIVPFGPGGASDFAARLIQPRLSELLGQQVVIENRAGASGNVGMEVAARKAPDGYTLFLGNVGTISVNPYVFVRLKVRPLDDFVPVSIVSDAPGVMVASPEFPASTVAELVRYAKRRPGLVTFASPGASSVGTLEMEWFAHQAGMALTQVPYKDGAGAAIKDLLGNHANVMIASIGSTLHYIEDGSLKALAVTTETRIPSLPGVPTMPEVGYPDTQSSSWQGVFVPKGTPRRIVEKLRAAIAEAMADRTIRERMEQSGVVALSSTSSDEFRQFLADDTKKWGKMVDLVGAKVE